jgi:hypothetical protein
MIASDKTKVFVNMGKSLLIIGFTNGTGINNKLEGYPDLRFLVVLNIIGQPVGEFSYQNLRIRCKCIRQFLGMYRKVKEKN